MSNYFNKFLLEPFTQFKGLPRSIYILSLQRFVTSLGNFVFPFLTMFMVQKLGLDKDVAAFWVVISQVAKLMGNTVGGSIADKLSRKKVIISISLANIIIFTVCGIIGTSMMVVYLLILTSFLGGISNPANSAMISDITVPENRKESFSLLYLSMNAGLAVSFTLAGYLFHNYYRWLFFGDALTTLLSLIPFILFVPESKPTKEDIEKIESSDREHEKFVEGSVFSALLKRPFLVAFILINTVVGFVYSQHGFVMPLHLTELFGDVNGPKYFGLVMSLNTIVVIFLMPITLSLTKKFRPVVNVFFATLLYTVGFGMMAFIDTMPMFFVAVFIWTIGEILSSMNTGVYISNHSPVNHRGKFSAIIDLVRFFGQAAAPAFMGTFLMTHSYSQAWIFTGFVGLFCAFSLFILYLAENNSKRKRVV